MGLIAKLKEIKEQLDSEGNEKTDDSCNGDENEDGNDSADNDREIPNSSDLSNRHANYTQESSELVNR